LATSRDRSMFLSHKALRFFTNPIQKYESMRG
jgi:hypothetical protein